MARRKRNKTDGHYSRLNKVELIRGGRSYFDWVVHMIENARDTIHFQTYIYDDDSTGKEVAEALKAAAKRKVKVYLLVDGYASRSMSHTFIKELEESGVYFRYFNPIFKSKYFYFGRRLHHKIIVVDVQYAMAGGINITDRYNDMPDRAAWLDFALYVEGEAAKELCILCWKTWRNYPANMQITPCEEKQIQFSVAENDACEVSVRRNDWVRRKNDISITYVNMLRHAKSHVTILSAYFLPGRIIRRQLRYAISRGVKIKLITAGVSDVKLAKYAERFMYDWLLRFNIELYEYQPSVLHGKIAVCDGQWVTIGSYNINDISAYASIELNLNVNNEGFAKRTEDTLLTMAEKNCVQITKENYGRSKNFFKRFLYWLSFITFRVLFYLSTFYFKHKE